MTERILTRKISATPEEPNQATKPAVSITQPDSSELKPSVKTLVAQLESGNIKAAKSSIEALFKSVYAKRKDLAADLNKEDSSLAKTLASKLLEQRGKQGVVNWLLTSKLPLVGETMDSRIKNVHQMIDDMAPDIQAHLKTTEGAARSRISTEFKSGLESLQKKEQQEQEAVERNRQALRSTTRAEDADREALKAEEEAELQDLENSVVGKKVRFENLLNSFRKNLSGADEE